MEVFLFLLLTALFLIIIYRNSSLSAKLQNIETELQRVRKALSRLDTQPSMKDDPVRTVMEAEQETTVAAPHPVRPLFVCVYVAGDEIQVPDLPHHFTNLVYRNTGESLFLRYP